MAFFEQQLDLGFDYGALGGASYRTLINRSGGGAEQRSKRWIYPLRRWQVGERTLDDSLTLYFQSFHAAVSGSFDGFRYKDWLDYRATYLPESGARGSTTQGVCFPEVGNGVITSFQMVKRYSIGGRNTDRVIKKPVANGELLVYKDNVLQLSGFNVDTTTGLIIFSAPPAATSRITWSGEFDVPARFEQDELPLRFDGIDNDGTRINYMGSLIVLETRDFA